MLRAVTEKPRELVELALRDLRRREELVTSRRVPTRVSQRRAAARPRSGRRAGAPRRRGPHARFERRDTVPVSARRAPGRLDVTGARGAPAPRAGPMRPRRRAAATRRRDESSDKAAGWPTRAAERSCRAARRAARRARLPARGSCRIRTARVRAVTAARAEAPAALPRSSPRRAERRRRAMLDATTQRRLRGAGASAPCRRGGRSSRAPRELAAHPDGDGAPRRARVADPSLVVGADNRDGGAPRDAASRARQAAATRRDGAGDRGTLDARGAVRTTTRGRWRATRRRTLRQRAERRALRAVSHARGDARDVTARRAEARLASTSRPSIRRSPCVLAARAPARSPTAVSTRGLHGRLGSLRTGDPRRRAGRRQGRGVAAAADVDAAERQRRRGAHEAAR